MHNFSVGPRFAGVYQVVALKKDESRDLDQEKQIFEELKKGNGDVFHKVAENLHKEERNRQVPGGTDFKPERSFLFTKRAGVITVLTGLEAQALSLLQPDVKVYPPNKDFPLPIHILGDKDQLVGRISSDSDSSVEAFLQDPEVNHEPLPSLDYNGFKPTKALRKERLGQAEEHRSIVRTNSERSDRAVRLNSLDRPRRSYSLKFTTPPQSPQEPLDSSSDAVHRSRSESLMKSYVERHASWPSSSSPQ